MVIDHVIHLIGYYESRLLIMSYYDSMFIGNNQQLKIGK